MNLSLTWDVIGLFDGASVGTFVGNEATQLFG